jgi:hypothetical protein
MEFRLVLDQFGLFQTAFQNKISTQYHLSQSRNPQGVPLWLVGHVKVMKLFKKRLQKVLKWLTQGFRQIIAFF